MTDGFKVPDWKWDEAYTLMFKSSVSLLALEDLFKLYENSWKEEELKINEIIGEYYKDRKNRNSNHPYEYEELIVVEIKKRAYISIFLGAYSVFENFLEKLRYLIEQSSISQIKFESIKADNSIDKYLRYLNEVYGQFGELPISVDKLHGYRLLRNFFAHKDALNNEYKSLEKIEILNGVETYPIVSVLTSFSSDTVESEKIGSGASINSNIFIFEMFEDFQNIIDFIHEKVQEHY